MSRWADPLVLFVFVVVVAAGVGMSRDRRDSQTIASPTRPATMGSPGIAAPPIAAAPVALAPGDFAPFAVSARSPGAAVAPGVPGAGSPPAERPVPVPAAQPPRPLHEAHWLGIEVIPLTPRLKRDLEAVPGAGRAPSSGVVIDQVSWPADAQGFAGGDVITRVGNTPTPDLASFVAATSLVRDGTQVIVDVDRQGIPLAGVLSASRLGTANGETAPEIPAGAVPPHGCPRAHAALLHQDTLGPCSQCHPIRSANMPPVDLAQVLPASPTPPGPVNPLCLPVQ